MADTSSAATRLADLLGAPAPEHVQSLPPAVLDRLIGQIEAGRRHHLRVADAAVDKAIKGVPLPVRGIVKKALT